MVGVSDVEVMRRRDGVPKMQRLKPRERVEVEDYCIFHLSFTMTSAQLFLQIITFCSSRVLLQLDLLLLRNVKSWNPRAVMGPCLVFSSVPIMSAGEVIYTGL